MNELARIDWRVADPEITARPLWLRKQIGSVATSLIIHSLVLLALWLASFASTTEQAISFTGSSASIQLESVFASRSETPQPTSLLASRKLTRSIPAAESQPRSDLSESEIATIRRLLGQTLAESAEVKGKSRTAQPRVATRTVQANPDRIDAGLDPGTVAPEQDSIDFFGIRASGNRFVFILDVSYSMEARGGDRFRRACDELLQSVASLQSGQSYYVFLFCWRTERMFFPPASDYIRVARGHQRELAQWIDNVRLGAGTDPRRALSLAAQMNPDAVYLLSDGQFNQPATPSPDCGWIDRSGVRFEADVQQGIERMFQRIPIHTIALENPFASSAMQRISAATGGNFRYAATQSYEPVDVARFNMVRNQIRRKIANGISREAEYGRRMSAARELIAAGEQAFAEYLLRPVLVAETRLVNNQDRLARLREILNRELGDRRLEDYQSPDSM